MRLFVVKEGSTLKWSPVVVRQMEFTGKYAVVDRRKAMRAGVERGGPGYCVDLDDPLERELISPNEVKWKLVPVDSIEDGRRRPRRPSKIEEPAYERAVNWLRMHGADRLRMLARRHDQYVMERDKSIDAALAERAKEREAFKADRKENGRNEMLTGEAARKAVREMLEEDSDQ